MIKTLKDLFEKRIMLHQYQIRKKVFSTPFCNFSDSSSIDARPLKNVFLARPHFFPPSRAMKTWILPVDGQMCRVVMERDTLDVWVNGSKAETAGEFTDEGTETHFAVNGAPAHIREKEKDPSHSWAHSFGKLHILARCIRAGHGTCDAKQIAGAST